jgi:hypothetical protein
MSKNTKEWDDMTKSEKRIGIIGLIVICIIVLGVIGSLFGGGDAASDRSINLNDIKGKEGLVVYKDLVNKNYVVSAEYVNDRLPSVNKDMTESFTSANVDNCEDRLGFDAYTVSDIEQSGDNVKIVLTVTPNSNQTCPDGSKYNP